MRERIIGLVALYAAYAAALHFVGPLPPHELGWGALWGAIVPTLLTIGLKPVLNPATGDRGRHSAPPRKTATARTVEYLVAFVLALGLWFVLVHASGATTRTTVVGWLLGALVLLVPWTLYDVVDDVFRRGAQPQEDDAAAPTATSSAAVPPSPGRPDETDTGGSAQDDGPGDDPRRISDRS